MPTKHKGHPKKRSPYHPGLINPPERPQRKQDIPSMDQLKALEQLVTVQEAKLLELQKRADSQGSFVLTMSDALIQQDNTIKDMLKSISILLDLEKARQAEVGGPVPPPKDTGVSEVA